MSSPERLFLLDGMALAYRAYFSFISRPLLNSRGENTSAIYGFVNTLLKILDDDRPEHIAVVFDTKEPTFRHKAFAAYKATRQKMPEDMASQLDKLKEVVQAFNVPLLEVPGYEADDVMGTLARRAEREGIETFLVTSDKDFMQLISPLIKMYRPGKQGNEWEIVDETKVLEKFGVPPELVIDVLGLTGDSSDNIPGVPGIGEKTAIPLVQQFGTIQNILKQIDSIPQKGVQKKLRENQELALLSRKLVTIDTNAPVEVDIHELKAAKRDTVRLTELLRQLEFPSLLRRIEVIPHPADTVEIDQAPTALSDASTVDHKYHLVTTEKELSTLVARLKNATAVALDTETTSENPHQAKLVGLSFAIEPGEAWFIPVRDFHQDTTTVTSMTTSGLFDKIDAEPESTMHTARTDGLPVELVLEHLTPLLEDSSILKIGQNIKYDMLVLASYRLQVAGTKFDTMIASYLLRPEARHNLDALATEHLQYKTVSFSELVGTGRERKDIRDVDLTALANYAAQDADITFRLYQIFSSQLKSEKLERLAEDIEFPLVDVLAKMELRGVTLDTGLLANLSVELERLLKDLVTAIHLDAGVEFNINSTLQLGRVLFEKLQLPSARKTKTGFSTDVGVLESLRHAHPIVEKLLEYRQLQKLKSTYVDALPALINPLTGRVHTSFNQTVALTGRLSSSDPNLQNIPIRTEIGRGIRKAFVAGEKNMLILAADYSQIELRIMAHVSGDEGLTTAFQNGEDIHATTAAKIFGVANTEVTKDMRRKAKEVNFGIMYGIGAFGLSNRLDVPQTEAKEIIDRYFERFPKVRQYIEDTKSTTRRTGFVSTLLGRRRYLPDINSRNQNIRGNAERQAINMPIQGTAADMIKLAMIRIDRSLQANALDAHMLLQVHDELVFEIAETEKERIGNLIVGEMKTALPLSVPIEVEVGVGKNWFEAH